MAWNNDSSKLVWTQPPPSEDRAFASTSLTEVCQFSHSISPPNTAQNCGHRVTPKEDSHQRSMGSSSRNTARGFGIGEIDNSMEKLRRQVPSPHRDSTAKKICGSLAP